jgi:dCMP deaminase
METGQITRATLKDNVFMSMAIDLMQLSTCRRRKVGCILVDDQYRIVGSGVNGVPRKWTHCTDEPCPGVGYKSGVGLETCQAIHAEQNALIQCIHQDSIWTAYCTSSPCMHCVKMLANTGCMKIVFKEEYDLDAGKLWKSHNGNNMWIKL